MLRGKQQLILNLPYEGHGVVCGVAGSGKSFCAVKRAEYLKDVTSKNVLLLTYNNSLINYMVDISGTNLSNIGVTTYHKFATACMRENNLLGYNEILSNDCEKKDYIEMAIDNIIKQIGKNSTLERKDFIIEEIEWMQRFGALTRDVYLTIERTGRGKSNLRSDNRKYIFDVYEEYIRIRTSKGYKYDWADLAYYFNNFLESGNIKNVYKHIIIDEAQDFSPMMIKSIVNYIGENGSILYLGDRAQQIYGKGKLSWIKLGLKINKVYTLDENHRNSKQIQELANAIRRNLDLEIEDGILSLNSIYNGDKPKIVCFSNEDNENIYLLEKVMEYKNQGTTCVIVKTISQMNYYSNIMNKELIYPISINRNTKNFSREEGIFIGTYQSVKGLEFDNVIIPKCSDSKLMPTDKSQIKLQEELDEIMNDIAKLVYVAVTRAKKRLIITYTDKLSSIIPKNNNICIFEKGE